VRHSESRHTGPNTSARPSMATPSMSRGVAFGWAAAGIDRPPAVGGVRRPPASRAVRIAPCESRPVVRARRDGVLPPLQGALHDGRPHRISPGAPPAERAWVACCAGRSCCSPVVDRDAEGGAHITAPTSRRPPRGAHIAARIAAPTSRRPHRGTRRARYPGDRDVA
jgi:hypothetical protein